MVVLASLFRSNEFLGIPQIQVRMLKGSFFS